ncbi:hypothetical protein K438DRAFT_806139 [Mycena galopus ATCC 62051]|nr:hypothetical protein K438DRAFT_806139 [Mycena galopus ATCC 62051]
MQRLAPPEMLDLHAARRAPQHHRHSRGWYMGRHAQCRRARVYAPGRDGRGGAEADGHSPRPPPRRTRPQLRSPRIPPHPCPSPRLLPFPTTKVPTATTRPSAASAPPPMRGPHVSCCVRGAGGDGRRGRGCRPGHPTRPQERRTPSHRRRPVASLFAPSSSSASASFSSSAVSSPFAPKHKQPPFASRYEYEYLTTTNAAMPTTLTTGWGGRAQARVRARWDVSATRARMKERTGTIGGTLRPHANGHGQAQGTRSGGNGSGQALPVRPDTDSESTYGYGYTEVHVDALDLGATVRAPIFS